MITIFSIPKPFIGYVGEIQRNAVRSWALLDGGVEVLLCGDEEGTDEVAEDVGAGRMPDLARNEYGTPLVSDAFHKAGVQAAHDVLCYVNADIILLDDFLPAVRQAVEWAPQFLMSGQRREVSAVPSADIGRPGWTERCRDLAERTGRLASPWAIDYFVFPRGAVSELPPFAVGRPGWDNWMIYRALVRGVPVVDATTAVVAVHQDHGYAHVPQKRGQRWQGPEADRNRELMGRARLAGDQHSFSLQDANWEFTRDGFRRRMWTQERRRRFVATLPALYPVVRPLMPVFRGLCRALPSAVWRRLGERMP